MNLGEGMGVKLQKWVGRRLRLKAGFETFKPYADENFSMTLHQKPFLMSGSLNSKE